MRTRFVEGVMRLAECVPSAIVVGLLLLLTIANAGAVTLDSGTDCWTTIDPSTAHFDLPAGYFTKTGGSSLSFIGDVPVTGDPACPVAVCGTCAAPTITWTDRHGTPVQPGDRHAVNQTTTPSTVDTCVRRKTSITLTSQGPAESVAIELCCLQLKGLISVLMSDSTRCEYAFKISLNGGGQSTGVVTFTPSSDPSTGTVRLGSLPADNLAATFTPVTSGCNPPLTGPQIMGTTFLDTPGTYTIHKLIPTLSDVGLTVLVVGLLLGMSIVMWRRYRRNAEA